jgi:hypothetical protein
MIGVLAVIFHIFIRPVLKLISLCAILSFLNILKNYAEEALRFHTYNTCRFESQAICNYMRAAFNFLFEDFSLKNSQPRGI